MATDTQLSRNSAQLAARLEENWLHIGEFFASRNWPDTALGRAASDLNADIPRILEVLRASLVSERAMPEEPTHQMIVAMHHAMWDGGPEADPVPGSVGYEHWKQIYGAALAAHRQGNEQ